MVEGKRFFPVIDIENSQSYGRGSMASTWAPVIVSSL